ncbi:MULTISPECIES: arginyltransferase [Pseudoxanthomonas]|uniref:Aspartate/glutamate leucyltransferase n=1 Tax=Pseudoxanthomonas taiwanensis J19 TaxID=935569 RepID=A0A562D8S1_9GAMM|nr:MULTISPECIES: arginyltransferase [Pseudoxanthomonas]TWH06002.1 arginine-tRNA-protein transferase [Pseudoxanthomonas taiwanensis J19]
MLGASTDRIAMGHDTSPADDLRLYQTGSHPCGYWPEREARDLVLDPRDPRLGLVYPQALEWGFRRSGDIVYRPSCAACRACVAVRIPVQRFQPDRSQRRCLRRNADISARIVPARRTDEHFDLYHRYLLARHRDGGMDDHGTAEFDQFLVGAWSDTRFLELREPPAPGSSGPGRLLAVAVTDRAPHGLSAVYTFYEPEEAARGLGTLAILRQLEWARREGLAHLYLGYWIDGHAKMDYKRRFRPLEAFDGRGWREFPY